MKVWDMDLFVVSAAPRILVIAGCEAKNVS